MYHGHKSNLIVSYLGYSGYVFSMETNFHGKWQQHRIINTTWYNHGSLSSIKKSQSRCQGPTPIESRTFGFLVLPKKCIMLGSNTKSLCIPPKVVILLHCKHQTSLLISKHLPLALSRSTTMVSASATSLASAWELWTVGRCVSRGIPNGKMCGQTNFHI